MRYWVEQQCDWDDNENNLWTLVMLFEFKEDAEKWIQNECKNHDIPRENFRIMDLVLNKPIC